MRSVGILLASALAFAAPAHATTVVFSDSFDAENGGVGKLNYSAFSNFTVTGKVDLVKSGSFGIKCTGGSGLCVDLDGTPGPGAITYNSTIAFAAGDLVRVSFDLSGSRRSGALDDFYAILSTGGAAAYYGVNYYGTDIITGASPASIISLSGFETLALRSVFFVAANDGAFTFTFGTTSGDRNGPVIDSISVSTGAVPEPATWGMMIAGFGVAGLALRRRKTNVAFA